MNEDPLWMDLILIVLCAFIFLSSIFLFVWLLQPHGVKKVDCSLAEFSPDISTEIKQLCREARKTK